jgi:WD40 repeat protein
MVAWLLRSKEGCSFSPRSRARPWAAPGGTRAGDTVVPQFRRATPHFRWRRFANSCLGHWASANHSRVQAQPDPIARMRLSPNGRTLVTMNLTNAHFFEVAPGNSPARSGSERPTNRISTPTEPDWSPVVGRSRLRFGRCPPANQWPADAPPRRHCRIFVRFRCNTGRDVELGSDGASLGCDHGRAVSPALAHMGFVHAGAFSPDGTMLLTGEQQGIVRLWNLTNRTTPRLTMRHTAPVLSVDWSAGPRPSPDVQLRQVGQGMGRADWQSTL